MPEPRAHRITPTLGASGCHLEIDGFVTDLLTDLLSLLGTDRDLMDRLVSVVEGPAQKPDPFRPEAELPTEQLVADLTDLLPTAIRVHGPALERLAGALMGIVQARRPLAVLPVQQEAGAA